MKKYRGYITKKSAKYKDDFGKYYYKTKDGESVPLFEKINIGRSDANKKATGMATVIRINWDWMKDYGWKVISEDQMESIGKEFVMYSDLGYGNYLECKRVDGVF